jgi:hypothetical protein
MKTFEGSYLGDDEKISDDFNIIIFHVGNYEISLLSIVIN